MTAATNDVGFWVGERHPFANHTAFNSIDCLMIVGQETSGIFVCTAKTQKPNSAISLVNESIIYSLGNENNSNHSWHRIRHGINRISGIALVEAFFVLNEQICLNRKWLDVNPGLATAAIEYRLLASLGAMM